MKVSLGKWGGGTFGQTKTLVGLHFTPQFILGLSFFVLLFVVAMCAAVLCGGGVYFRADIN